MSNYSNWDLVEYRIDENIYIDSDGNGEPADDIDNMTDASFYNWSKYETVYRKTKKSIVAQLTVVSRDGQGSLIQKEIVFDDPTLTIEAPQKTGFIAYQTEIFVGESINFQVQNPSEWENYKWDFDGDSKPDLETQETDVSFVYEEAGEFLVTLMIQPAEGNVLTEDQRILVKTKELKWPEYKTLPPIANFEYASNGAVAQFENKSSVDPHLQNSEYTSSWNFGDEKTSEEQSPQHDFEKFGEYLVILEITDSVGNTSENRVKITIEEQIKEISAQTETGAVATTEGDVDGKNILWSILKMFLYLIFGIILLVVLGLGGYLVYLKIKHPDFTFSELIEEEKRKFFGDELQSDIDQTVPLKSGETKIQTWEIKEETEKAPEETVADIPQAETVMPEESESKPQETLQTPTWLQQAKDSLGTQEQSQPENQVEEKSVQPDTSAEVTMDPTPIQWQKTKESITPIQLDDAIADQETSVVSNTTENIPVTKNKDSAVMTKADAWKEQKPQQPIVENVQPAENKPQIESELSVSTKESMATSQKSVEKELASTKKDVPLVETKETALPQTKEKEIPKISEQNKKVDTQPQQAAEETKTQKEEIKPQWAREEIKTDIPTEKTIEQSQNKQNTVKQKEKKMPEQRSNQNRNKPTVNRRFSKKPNFRKLREKQNEQTNKQQFISNQKEVKVNQQPQEISKEIKKPIEKKPENVLSNTDNWPKKQVDSTFKSKIKNEDGSQEELKEIPLEEQKPNNNDNDAKIPDWLNP